MAQRCAPTTAASTVTRDLVPGGNLQIGTAGPPLSKSSAINISLLYLRTIEIEQRTHCALRADTVRPTASIACVLPCQTPIPYTYQCVHGATILPSAGQISRYLIARACATTVRLRDIYKRIASRSRTPKELHAHGTQKLRPSRCRGRSTGPKATARPRSAHCRGSRALMWPRLDAVQGPHRFRGHVQLHCTITSKGARSRWIRRDAETNLRH